MELPLCPLDTTNEVIKWLILVLTSHGIELFLDLGLRPSKATTLLSTISSRRTQTWTTSNVNVGQPWPLPLIQIKATWFEGFLKLELTLTSRHSMDLFQSIWLKWSTIKIFSLIFNCFFLANYWSNYLWTF